MIFEIFRRVFQKIKKNISFAGDSLDFFVVKVSDRFTFENKKTYSTNLGKVASWILIILTALVFANFGGNMFYHKNPQSVTSQIVTPEPEYLDLQDSGFFMAFGLQDLRNKSIHFIDERIYTVKLIQRTKVGTNITLEDIKVEKCEINQVPNRDDLRSYFARNQLNNLYCISNNSQVKASLEKTWDSPLYRNVLLNIYPCKNSSDSQIICKSDEEINAYLNSANYAMYFTNLAVDPNDFERPISAFGKQLYTPISATTLTYIEMLFGHINFISDNGLIFEELNTTKKANYVSSRQILSNNPNYVVQIDMKLDKIKTLYYRKYDKIQNVLANMGGIIKALTILIQLFVGPFVKLWFKLDLANSMFSFKLPKEAKIYEKPKRMKRSQNSFKSTPQEIQDYFKPTTLKLTIKSLKYFFSCFRGKINKIYNQLLDKGIYQIDRILNLSYIMNKLSEIEVLKTLLLDKYQKDLFEYIPKPKISLESLESGSKFHSSLRKEIGENLFKTNEEKAKLAFKAYNLINSKRERTNIDEKLLELLPKNAAHEISFKLMDSDNKSIHSSLRRCYIKNLGN